MKILSIRISEPEPLTFQGRTLISSINKKEVKGPVRVTKLGLVGDTQSDLKVHGGVTKAIYAFSHDAYPWWKQKRPNTEFPYGAFGENLTLESLDENKMCLGDRFMVGSAVLEVSEPRFPCAKLGYKYQDMNILNEFNESDRPGVYFRVADEGLIDYGDQLVCIHSEPNSVSIRELFRIKNNPKAFKPGYIQAVSDLNIVNEAWKARLRKLL